jgi:hypothetical protein
MNRRCTRTLLLLGVLLVLASCKVSSDEAKTHALFDIGYGKTDFTFDLSASEKNNIGLSINKGIFHILSRGEAKILSISSYGQTLAMWYDPARGSAPMILKDVKIDAGSSKEDMGRFATQVSFVDPWPMAADSRQTLYVADRKSNQVSANGTENSAYGAEPDRIVRRFDANGKELGPLGQEGIAGSPFPEIMRLEITENDTLAVICASETETLVYFYDRNGVFLHLLKLKDNTLPIPAQILKKNPEGKGLRIIPSLESIIPAYVAGKTEVILKINYYLENYDVGTGVTLSIDQLGGWILQIDASAGSILNAFPLQSGMSETGVNLQLVAAKKDSFLTIRWADQYLGGELLKFDSSGKVTGKLSIRCPDEAAAFVAMTVGDDGYLYLLASLPSALRMYAWKIPGM